MATSRTKILVVEDEADIRDLMLLHLKREGYEMLSTDNGEEAIRLIDTTPFSLVIVDWMLPGVSGLDVCRSIARKVPVLMVTARADASDIVLGLEMGADDYVTKPFEIPVFVARVRALIRRSVESSRSFPASDHLRIENLAVNIQNHEVLCGSEKVQLTPSEFKLLVALMRNAGRVLSRDQLIELVQGDGVVVVDRAIDTHVFGLRKKLGPCAEIIETIRGVGYRVK